MRVSGIYKIQSVTHPDRIYIGSAVSISKRWDVHNFDLRNNKHDNQRLQNHFNKYGKDDLQFTVLEVCDKELLIQREQHYIDRLNPWFNISKVAGSTSGYRHSLETRDLLRRLRIGKEPWNKGKKLPPLSDNQKAGISKKLLGNQYAKGYKHSEETKQKERGRVPWNKGVGRTEETKDKIRNTLLSRKQSSWNKGKHHTEETIHKMSEARKNYYLKIA